MDLGDIFVPALMVFILCYGLVKKVDIVNVFCEGAAESRRGADTNAHSAYDSSGNVHLVRCG